MISFPKPPSTALSQQAYQRRITGQGPTYLQCHHTMINCPKCDKSIQQGNFTRHLKQVHKELSHLEIPPVGLDPSMSLTTTNRLLYIHQYQTLPYLPCATSQNVLYTSHHNQACSHTSTTNTHTTTSSSLKKDIYPDVQNVYYTPAT